MAAVINDLYRTLAEPPKVDYTQINWSARKCAAFLRCFFVLFFNIDSVCFNLFSSFLKNTQNLN